MRKAVVRFGARAWPILLAASVFGMLGRYGLGCSGWDPTRPFERNSPDVDRALAMLDAGELESAEDVLSEYLGTGTCKNGEIGLPESVRARPDGSFDLGLVLFYLGEKYGRRFGDEIRDAGPEDEETIDERRDHEVRCALIVALAIASDSNVPVEVRARAYYLAGNLEFMRTRYKDAIRFYEQALRLIPGIVEEAGGDGVGRDAAWNRAVALRRIEEEEPDAGPDAEPDAEEPDAGPDAEEDGPPDPPDGDQDGGDGDSGDDGGGDDAGDAGGDQQGDAGEDGGEDGGDAGGDPKEEDEADAGGDPNEPDPQAPPQPSDPDPKPGEPGGAAAPPGDRILDRYEQAPSYQQEEAKRRAEGRRRGMEDK